jgi:hypothetical protein
LWRFVERYLKKPCERDAAPPRILFAVWRVFCGRHLVRPSAPDPAPRSLAPQGPSGCSRPHPQHLVILHTGNRPVPVVTLDLMKRSPARLCELQALAERVGCSWWVGEREPWASREAGGQLQASARKPQGRARGKCMASSHQRWKWGGPAGQAPLVMPGRFPRERSRKGTETGLVGGGRAAGALAPEHGPHGIALGPGPQGVGVAFLGVGANFRRAALVVGKRQGAE